MSTARGLAAASRADTSALISIWLESFLRFRGRTGFEYCDQRVPARPRIEPENDSGDCARPSASSAAASRRRASWLDAADHNRKSVRTQAGLIKGDRRRWHEDVSDQLSPGSGAWLMRASVCFATAHTPSRRFLPRILYVAAEHASGASPGDGHPPTLRGQFSPPSPRRRAARGGRWRSHGRGPRSSQRHGGARGTQEHAPDPARGRPGARDQAGSAPERKPAARAARGQASASSRDARTRG